MQEEKEREREGARHTNTPTIHTVAFGVAHIEAGGLHVWGKDIPPFILITQYGLGPSRTLLTRCKRNSEKNTIRKQKHM